MNFCNYACIFTLQGLWGGPFLREAHGLSRIEVGNTLLGAVFAYQLGVLVFSPLDRVLDTRKWISVGGTLVIAAILASLAFLDPPPAWFAIAAIIAIGLFSASGSMIITHGRAMFPDRLIGRGMATMNTSVMLGVAGMQSFSDIILDAFTPLADGTRTELAYRSLLGMLCAVLLIAACVYVRVPDICPSDDLRARAAKD